MRLSILTVVACLSCVSWLRANVPVVFVSRDVDTVRAGAPRNADDAVAELDVNGDGIIDEREQNVPPVLPEEERTSAIETASYGRLVYLHADGTARNLVDSRAVGAPATTPVDVMDPDVSYDGERIVFAGYSAAEDGWRIYEVGVDGTGLRQITRSDREVDLDRYGEAAAKLEGHDDLDPCYLPDGRICFVSTRMPGIAPDNRLRTTNLYVVNADGGGLHRITSERFGADTPAVDPVSGQIVYSRWWRTTEVQIGNEDREPIPPGSPGYDVDPSQTGFTEISPDVVRGVNEDEFPGVNSWFLASINPDGSDMAMFTGVRLDREATQAYRPAFFETGETLALFIPKTPFIGLPRGNGLRLYERGANPPTALGGPQTFSGVISPINALLPIDPAIPPERLGESFNYVFASAAPLPDSRLIVSAAPLERTHYDLFIVDPETRRMLPLFANAELADLDAVPAIERDVPPVIEDVSGRLASEDYPQTAEEAYSRGSFTFHVENIYFQPPVDANLVNSPPVGQDLTIEFYMAPQRTSADASDEPILLKSRPLPPSGDIAVELPSGVPLFELIRRPDGTLAQGRDGQIFHVAGMNFNVVKEGGSCVGCHAGHSMLQVPQDPSFTNLASSATVTSFPQTELPFEMAEPGPDGQIVADGDLFALFLSTFGPHNLVDRRTIARSEWIGDTNNVQRSELRFEWPVALEGKRVTVHPASNGSDLLGPGEGFFGPRDLRIRGFVLETMLNGTVQQQIPVRALLETGGEPIDVRLDPAKPFNAMHLLIEPGDVSGVFEFAIGPALSEVEVTARVAASDPEPRTASFLRGDSDCDGGQNISDAVTVLNFLFLRGGPLCCEAAGDVNADASINLTDPIHLLNYLFLGGAAPARPGTECGTGELGPFGCGIENCP